VHRRQPQPERGGDGCDLLTSLAADAQEERTQWTGRIGCRRGRLDQHRPNPLERLNAEIKRRTNHRHFPNDASIVRLIVAGSLKTLVIALTLVMTFLTEPWAYYVYLATIEISITVYIVRGAWNSCATSARQ
jgi:hypothetical protein